MVRLVGWLVGRLADRLDGAELWRPRMGRHEAARVSRPEHGHAINGKFRNATALGCVMSGEKQTGESDLARR